MNAHAAREIKRHRNIIAAIEADIAETAAEDWGSETHEKAQYIEMQHERARTHLRHIQSYENDAYRRRVAADNDDALTA